MPDLFPFVYQCSACGHETAVTRADAQEVSADPDMFSAMAVLLRRREWTRSPKDNALYCPDCIDGATEDAE